MALFLRQIIRNNKVLYNMNLVARMSEQAKLSSSHKVNNWERKFLVWTKKYKNVAEVPDYVPQNVMERARNRMRIKIANCMMAATALGCLTMIYFGKKAQQRGESVSQMNLDWHKQFNEQNQEQKK